MKDSLPPQLLKEKLPRFLQKCTQTFETDRRYRNDLRYLRVWLQLMDYVENPRALLKAMESNGIGTKHSLFYQAYALYYEKNKKFDEAEKMYYLGVQNLAEPLDELQKSYEQFLHRTQRHKKQITQRLEKPMKRKTEENDENERGVGGRPRSALHDESLTQLPLNEKDAGTKNILEGSSQPLMECNHTDASIPRNKQQGERGSDKSTMLCSDDTVVVKFVGTAIVGKSETEDACHHGLVDPTINMKEAMIAINSMFSEPLEVAPRRRRQPKNDGHSNNGFHVFVDENSDGGFNPADKREEKSFPLLQHGRRNQQAEREPLSIFIDDAESDRIEDGNPAEDIFEQSDICNSSEHRSASRTNVFVFPNPKDLPSESSDDMEVEGSPRPRFREDTVVCRFVGSTISDEPVVENVCHHGLVDPTINLKEAMDDINNMFGKPIDFVRSKRSKRQDKAPDMKSNFGGFTILPDDDVEPEPVKAMPKSSGKSRGCDLFEPTMVTKEAIDDINKMFGMPLDF